VELSTAQRPQVVQPLGSSQYFMELEGSLPSLQELYTCTYPGPDQSSPQHSILSLKGPSKCYLSTYVSVFLVVSFPLAFLPITYTRSSSPPFVLMSITTGPNSSEPYKTLRQCSVIIADLLILVDEALYHKCSSTLFYGGRGDWSAQDIRSSPSLPTDILR
jgi:hypothetical protein